MSATPGKRIKTERERRGLTQTQLANEIKKTQPFVSQMERGLVSLPSEEVRSALADQLGFDPYSRRAAVKAGKLSASEAASRHRIDVHALLNLIYAKKIRARFLGDGLGFELDEQRLRKDLAKLPRCPHEGCEEPKTGEWGCGEHGQALWAESARGSKRPVEVCRAISRTKRQNPQPRPDAQERCNRLWEEDGTLRNTLHAEGKLLLDEMAASLGYVRNTVSALVSSGELPVQYERGPIGLPHPTIEPLVLGTWAYQRYGSTGVFGRLNSQIAATKPDRADAKRPKNRVGRASTVVDDPEVIARIYELLDERPRRKQEAIAFQVANEFEISVSRDQVKRVKAARPAA